jgi:hypothetical protein
MTLSELLNEIDGGVFHGRDTLIDALRDANRQLGELLQAQGQPAFVQLGEVIEYNGGAPYYLPKVKHPLYDED